MFLALGQTSSRISQIRRVSQKRGVGRGTEINRSWEKSIWRACDWWRGSGIVDEVTTNIQVGNIRMGFAEGSDIVYSCGRFRRRIEIVVQSAGLSSRSLITLSFRDGVLSITMSCSILEDILDQRPCAYLLWELIYMEPREIF